ncbi:hypothetical protein GTY85_00790 [Streptomyces sp. SID8377]|nr:hypothetical protein [Streptomyces sp. SID8377]
MEAADRRWCNAKPRGEGVDLDYRPSPRQLRRSSPKRMMLSTIAEPPGTLQPLRRSSQYARPPVMT